ncbi:MAG: RRXRR domain-containing protein [Ktedonobacteraceae bacterium]
MFVPVIDRNGTPLMPTTPGRARRFLKSGKATPFWKGGVFCIRLNVEPSAREAQQIAVGIDPGSKKEGYSVASAAHTYLNIQADAVVWVSDAVAKRRQLRRSRRGRKAPCRKPRSNKLRAEAKISPSTKARWQWKLRLANALCQLFPVSVFVVEDIKACTKGKRLWDQSFSPLQVGKAWFYGELGKLAPVQIVSAWETKVWREQKGLKKTGRKTAEAWNAHCVDAWVLAAAAIGGEITPDNTRLLCLTPFRWHRRQLHRLEPERGAKRKSYGGTLSLGIKRGTLIVHPSYGKAYVGGTMGGKLSLHDLDTGRRITQGAKLSECRLVKLLRWRTRLLPLPKIGIGLRARTK